VYQIYTLLIGVHIFTAIIGVGPSLLLNRILKNAKNMDELKYAHKVVKELNKVANIGFGLLLPTGLLMGWINPSLFQMIWYNASIALFVVAGLYLHFVIEPKMKPMLEILRTYEGEEIPQQYKILFNKLVPYDWFGKMLVIVIIILMVFKP
jgi:uncharacterized membrane protein